MTTRCALRRPPRCVAACAAANCFCPYLGKERFICDIRYVLAQIANAYKQAPLWHRPLREACRRLQGKKENGFATCATHPWHCASVAAPCNLLSTASLECQECSIVRVLHARVMSSSLRPPQSLRHHRIQPAPPSPALPNASSGRSRDTTVVRSTHCIIRTCGDASPGRCSFLAQESAAPLGTPTPSAWQCLRMLGETSQS